MVVLMMHIPLEGVGDRQEVYRLIEQRPFCISISGHTHYQEHRFITQADGWQGPKPHHHIINVTACGSWWSGAPDERGIPHSLMACGAPNGHSVIEFDGQEYRLEFVPGERVSLIWVGQNAGAWWVATVWAFAGVIVAIGLVWGGYRLLRRKPARS